MSNLPDDLSHFDFDLEAPRIEWIDEKKTGGRKIPKIEAIQIGYLESLDTFPIDPTFFEFPDQTQCFWPQNTNKDDVLSLSKDVFNQSQASVNRTSGHFKNLVFKNFYCWTIEFSIKGMKHRVLLYQGKNKDNFYILGLFNESIEDEMKTYTVFLTVLEQCSAKQLGVTEYKY
jgi:hypothetical protein